MKKLLALILILSLCFSLTACGGDQPSASQSANDKSAASQGTGSEKTEDKSEGKTEGKAEDESGNKAEGKAEDKTEDKAPEHKHDWKAATCSAPKTCSSCGETEGNPAEHKWEDATCSAPKTCSVCKKTDGEALPHSLSEATYQTAATCEVCGATEGEPLPAYFEVKNYPMAELDTSYEYTNIAYDDYSITQTNWVTLSNYRVIASDDQHPAKEGYEWRIVDVHFMFGDPTVPEYGYTYGLSSADYYSGICYNDTIDTLHYNGVDYTECDDEYITLWQEWLAYDLASVDISAGFLVPIGYDGFVLIVLNPYDILMDDSAATVDGYEDMSPIFFRMN